MKITSSNYFIKQNYSNITSPLKSGKINDFNYGKYYSVFSDKKISPIYFKANFPVFKKENIDFQYSPISSKSPNFNLVGSYDDLDKFSELFADKLNSMLYNPSIEDIERLIARIKEKTGENEEKIYEVLYNLTQFSSDSSLCEIRKFTDENNIYSFENDMCSMFSSNDAMHYLLYCKSQKNLMGYKIGIILDEYTLSYIEKIMKSDDKKSKAIAKSLTEQIKLGDLVFLNIPSWDIKCSDGKYRSANLLSGSGYLEALAVDIIKRMQKGEQLDDILYSDLEERLKKTFENKVSEINVKKIEVKPAYNITANSILENMQTGHYTPEKIKKVLSTYLDACSLQGKNRNMAQNLLMRYLDQSSLVFSFEGLARSLKALNEKIIKIAKRYGKKPDDIAYCIPYLYKSFTLISYMYAKINQIPLENIFFNLFGIENKEMYKDKLKVVLDDISASGDTQSETIRLIRETSDSLNDSVFYSTVVATNRALKAGKEPIEKADENIYEHLVFDWSKALNAAKRIAKKGYSAESIDDILKLRLSKKEQKLNPLISPFEILLLENLLKTTGYSYSGLSCAFPYMLPDNNSGIASSVLGCLQY